MSHIFTIKLAYGLDLKGDCLFIIGIKIKLEFVESGINMGNDFLSSYNITGYQLYSPLFAVKISQERKKCPNKCIDPTIGIGNMYIIKDGSLFWICGYKDG